MSVEIASHKTLATTVGGLFTCREGISLMKRKTVIRIAFAVGTIYIFLLLAPIAGFDPPRILGTITSQPQLVLRYLVIGLSNGAIFAIIALGYTMVYGIIQLINFAHGDVFMMSTFMALKPFLSTRRLLMVKLSR